MKLVNTDRIPGTPAGWTDCWDITLMGVETAIKLKKNKQKINKMYSSQGSSALMYTVKVVFFPPSFDFYSPFFHTQSTSSKDTHLNNITMSYKHTVNI